MEGCPWVAFFLIKSYIMSKVLNLARRDLKRHTSTSGDWNESATFTPPGGGTPATVELVHTKHHLSVDPETGVAVNDKVASCHVSEDCFPASYPLRDADGNVNLDGHTVAIADSTGTVVTYFIEQFFPDEMLGHIVFMLGSYS
jgi:hypothetical protein